MENNKKIYNTLEFNHWANREKLLPEEKALIIKYLDKKSKTVEAGTSGGRILLSMLELGFECLYGFDFVAKFIEVAKNRDSGNQIAFSVQDASNLEYENESFAQAIYLQQIISNITDESTRLKSLQEAFRILKPGGIILFSFLSFESKKRSIVSKLFFLYLSVLRFLGNNKLSLQYLPWFKHSGKTNWFALLDKAPYNYWFRIQEIQNILTEIGFFVKSIGFPKNIKNNTMKSNFNQFSHSDLEGHIYFVCTKN